MDLDSQIFVCRCAEWAALNGYFPAWIESYAKWRAVGRDAFFSAALATGETSGDN